jgi:ferric-dicitrate binding protein FerR (iron transport regulator)
MNDDRYTDLLFFDELTPETRRALWADVEDDPALARALSRWRTLCEHVRRDFAADLPDCRLLVAYALAEDGHADLLDEQERYALEAARPAIEAAREAHPALDTIVATIRAERADFDAVWQDADLHVAEAADAPVSNGARAADRNDARAADRAPRPAPRRQTRTMTRWVVAAVAVALLGAVALFVLRMDDAADAPALTFAAEAGETRVADLPDGTTVRLVGPARLTYAPRVEGQRRAELPSGRAFFDVAHDPEAPFVVASPGARTVVLGTRFGVTAQAETDGAAASTEVVLAFGRVRLEAADAPSGSAEAGSVTLAPGQASRVAAGQTSPALPRSVDLTGALDWTGLLVFRDTPAAAAARHLALHYNTPVVVEAPLASEPLTGTFEEDQPLPEVLDALAAALGARVEPVEDGYRLVARGE